MKKTSNLDEFAQAGIAALLPGMRYMVELMTAAVGDKQTLLALLQDGANRPSDGAGSKLGSGWPSDPAERSAEMKRRMAVAAAKKKTLDNDLSKHRKKEWAKMSPAKKKARLDAMAAGRQKRQRAQKKTERATKTAPVVQMEKTA